MLRMKISHRQFNQADGESWSPEIITIQPKYGTRSGYFTTVCFSNSCATVSSRSFSRLMLSPRTTVVLSLLFLLLVFEHSHRY